MEADPLVAATGLLRPAGISRRGQKHADRSAGKLTNSTINLLKIQNGVQINMKYIVTMAAVA
jgi:hypothetical protein